MPNHRGNSAFVGCVYHCRPSPWFVRSFARCAQLSYALRSASPLLLSFYTAHFSLLRFTSYIPSSALLISDSALRSEQHATHVAHPFHPLTSYLPHFSSFFPPLFSPPCVALHLIFLTYRGRLSPLPSPLSPPLPPLLLPPPPSPPLPPYTPSFKNRPSFSGEHDFYGAFTPQPPGRRCPRCRWQAPDTIPRREAGACHRASGFGSAAAGARRASSTASADVWRSAC